MKAGEVLRKAGLAMIPAAFLLAGSCAGFPPRIGTAAESPPPGTKSPAPGTRASTRASAPLTEEQVLRELPRRVREFLEELRRKLMAGDLAWVASRAEPSHRERHVRRRGMDDASYLALLMDVGGSFARGESPLAPEPGSFDLSKVSSLRFMEARRQDFSWVVTGLMTDRRGRSIDFSLDVLGDLEPIMLTGNQ